MRRRREANHQSHAHDPVTIYKNVKAIDANEKFTLILTALMYAIGQLPDRYKPMAIIYTKNIASEYQESNFCEMEASAKLTARLVSGDTSMTAKLLDAAEPEIKKTLPKTGRFH